jgi:release factor glutamine methyltransferase
LRNLPTASRDERTLRAALAEACRQLEPTSPTPRLDAEVLLAHVLGKNRSYLRTWPDSALAPRQIEDYTAWVAARARGMPIAYLVGYREFWSRDFLVSPDVLIPRPETELLLQLALEAVAARPEPYVADLGTGSGVLAVTLAAERRDATVHAADISQAALRIARSNAGRHGVGRIRFLLSDWFSAFPEDLRFDAVVSNPPYLGESDPHLREGDLRFEPHLALTGGADGLEAFRAIAEQSRTRLHADGVLLLEHGYDQAGAMRSLLQQFGYRKISQHRDLQGHPRVTRALAPAEVAAER